MGYAPDKSASLGPGSRLDSPIIEGVPNTLCKGHYTSPINCKMGQKKKPNGTIEMHDRKSSKFRPDCKSRPVHCSAVTASSAGPFAATAAAVATANAHDRKNKISSTDTKERDGMMQFDVMRIRMQRFLVDRFGVPPQNSLRTIEGLWKRSQCHLCLRSDQDMRSSHSPGNLLWIFHWRRNGTKPDDGWNGLVFLGRSI